jgi:hypothetical protein
MHPPVSRCTAEIALSGLLGGVLSTLALGWRGRIDSRSAIAPVNAPSQWIWGDEALASARPTLRHTGVGALVHHASSLFWASFYALCDFRRRGNAAAWCGAAATAALAAAVDLAVVPQRLTPGFQHRLSRRSLVWVYASFATGLALSAMIARRREQARRVAR